MLAYRQNIAETQKIINNTNKPITENKRRLRRTITISLVFLAIQLLILYEVIIFFTVKPI